MICLVLCRTVISQAADCFYKCVISGILETPERVYRCKNPEKVAAAPPPAAAAGWLLVAR